MPASPASASAARGPLPASPLRWRWQTLGEVRELWPYLRPFRFKFSGGMLLGLLAAGLALTLPYCIGVIVDAAGGETPRRALTSWTPDARFAGWLLVSALIVQAVSIFAHFTWVAAAGEQAVAALRGAVFERLVRQRMLFFAQQRVGELTTRLTADLAELRVMLSQTLPLLLRQFLVLAGSAVLLVSASPRLALLLFAVFPALGIVVGLLSRRIRQLQRGVQDELASVGAVAAEALAGIATVKSFHQEQREVTRYDSAQQSYLRSAFRIVSVQAGMVAFMILTMSLVISAVIWHGVSLVRVGQLTIGELTRFVIYAAFLAGGMGVIADRFGAVQRALGSTQRLRELLQEETEPLTKDDPATPKRLRGDVEFCNVSFAYPSRPGAPVLNGFSLQIAAGECLALVGPSGSGKTTAASLLLRFYEPDRGQLMVDGRDVKSYSLTALREQIAIVPQDVVLFSGTIAENIAYGKAEATPDEITEAARQAHAHEFITALPERYATLVGERGVQLSGGQRQRIAIARCILRNPAVLILDEATSALDSESERLLREAMRSVVVGRTTLVIAHRLSTVSMANRIAVLAEGTLVEQGTHDELMQQPRGLYRSLMVLQAALAH